MGDPITFGLLTGYLIALGLIAATEGLKSAAEFMVFTAVLLSMFAVAWVAWNAVCCIVVDDWVAWNAVWWLGRYI